MRTYFKNASDIENFIINILQNENVEDITAKRVAEGLVQTSLRGVDSHGIRLFPHYVKSLKAGRINGKPNFKFQETSPTTGILDADHTFGHSAGIEAVKYVKEMAYESGSGHIAIKNSTHFGSVAQVFSQFVIELHL